MVLGIISDTHGLLRPEALRALRDCTLIVHAGDVGHPAILDELATLAPVTAVRGNIDRESWARSLPVTAVVQASEARLYVVHDLKTLAIEPAQSGYAAVISGHSHKAAAFTRDGVLYLNPGSAGPRRFRLPVTLARLRVGASGLEHEIVNLCD